MYGVGNAHGRWVIELKCGLVRLGIFLILHSFAYIPFSFLNYRAAYLYERSEEWKVRYKRKNSRTIREG